MRTIRFDDELSREYKGIKEKYIYTLDDGEQVILEMAYGEMLARQEQGGFVKISENCFGRRNIDEELERDGIAPRSGQKLRTKARWPMTSVRAGVNPSQRQELLEHWKKHGVTGCDVQPNGDVTWDSPGARRADIRSRGMVDRSGFD